MYVVDDVQEEGSSYCEGRCGGREVLIESASSDGAVRLRMASESVNLISMFVRLDGVQYLLIVEIQVRGIYETCCETTSPLKIGRRRYSLLSRERSACPVYPSTPTPRLSCK